MEYALTLTDFGQGKNPIVLPVSRCTPQNMSVSQCITGQYNGTAQYGQQYYDKYAAASTNTPTAPTTPTQPTTFSYKVRVRIDNLRIRKGPGTNYASRGYTGAGIFTIVDEADGPGATRWGLLKSYKSKRNGWISLEYAAKL